MKKFVSIILCLVLLLSFCGCNGDNNTNIEVSEKEISDTVFLNKITNQANHNYLSYAFAEPDLTEQYEKVVLAEDAAEVKDYLIESKIIVEECKEFDILITQEETKNAVETEHNRIKEPSQEEYYNALLSALEQNNITETEYLSLLESDSYYKYNKISLKNHFSDKKYDSSKSESLDKQFEQYIDKLVEDYLK